MQRLHHPLQRPSLGAAVLYVTGVSKAYETVYVLVKHAENALSSVGESWGMSQKVAHRPLSVGK